MDTKFKKGHEKKGGRKAGTPNKATGFSKNVIQEIVSCYTDSGDLQKDLKKLEPKDRLDIMIKLIAFITPKPQSIDMNLQTSEKLTIEHQLRELSAENEESI